MISFVQLKFNHIKYLFIILLAYLFLWPKHSYSQDSTRFTQTVHRVHYGLGLGLDYGGIGFNFSVFPQKNIGVFGGIGYAEIGIGYNAGLKIRKIAKKEGVANPYILGMMATPLPLM